MNIQIAEDNFLNQKIIEVLIKRMGWACRIVNDGVEVVEECLKDGYDLILMDIDMPQMDNFEATSAHRGHCFLIWILYLKVRLSYPSVVL